VKPEADRLRPSGSVTTPREWPWLHGGVTVLAVGRLGKGITTAFADQSLIARTLLLGAARHSIRIIQQDVAFALDGIDPVWPDAALERISDLVTQRGGDVYIVLSNLGAAGAVGHYSYGVRLETVANRILEIAGQRSHLDHRPLVDLMCRHLHLAPMRLGPYAAWPNNRPIAVHAQFWMVDDRVFYIGSENLYPLIWRSSAISWRIPLRREIFVRTCGTTRGSSHSARRFRVLRPS